MIPSADAPNYELVLVPVSIPGQDKNVSDKQFNVATHRWSPVTPVTGRTAVCVHGLTRNARDFDYLAGRLIETGKYSQVVCIDVPGRGQSENLTNPAGYEYPTYAQVVKDILVSLNVPSVDYIGTSMGGLIGMMIAAFESQSETKLIRCLVMNDIGPFVPETGLARLLTYVDKRAVEPLADMDAAEVYIRDILSPFGELTDDQWKFLTKVSVRPSATGQGFDLAYDSQIGVSLVAKAPFSDISLWTVWDAVNTRVLVIHGEESDLLSHATCDEMSVRGPLAKVVHVPKVGHAPALLSQADTDPIIAFVTV